MKAFMVDFKDIFSEKMNELPPMREVDHAIDMVADATPIRRHHIIIPYLKILSLRIN
jgi:hypothetical protein